MPKYNCSFHGIVEEVPGISVDNFSNIGSKFRAYFLSHCHTDHASGIDGIPLLEHLQKTQTTYIYMSKLTAAIIEDEAFKFSNLDDDVRMQHVKSLMNYIKVLDLGHNSITLKAVPEEGLEQLTVAVELITAGHSLGSVMFLFQTYAKTVLFTGDFRISVNDVAKYKQFHDQNGDPIHIDKMYIDTTFAEPRYEYFPKRSQSIDFAIGKIRQHINKSEENIVVLETSARYTYEYVFNEIYRQLGLKVSVSKDQWRFYSKFPTEIPGVTDSCSRILLASKGNTYSSNGNQLTLKLSAMRWSSYQEDDETYHGDGNCLYVCFATHCSFNEIILISYQCLSVDSFNSKLYCSCKNMSSVVEDICELLDSYNGRDKVVRLACYAFKLHGCLNNEKSWETAGSRLSSARLMLRLFDDIPMIRHTYNYGLGRHESSKMAAVLGVLANAVDQLFLPVEKVCWLQDVGVLRLSPTTSERLDIISTALWAVSLYISLIQNIRSMQQLHWSRNCLQTTSEDGGADAKRNLDVRLALQAAAAGKLCLDITHAVSCLPHGWLWGERIGATKVAAIATTSSVMGILLYFARKRLLK